MPTPARCGTCQGEVTWGEDPAGRLVPINRTPTPTGDWIFDRPGSPNARPVRQLTAGEQPPSGTHRFTSHYDTCPGRKPR